MKIHYEKIPKEVKDVVSTRAKYQKVMLVFDETAEEIILKEIYEQIKDLCIFNRVRIEQIDEQELKNGYRLIIYVLSGESYLKCMFDKNEYINIFCPTDNKILPFFLDETSTLKNCESHLIIKNEQFDLNMISSVCFNIFFNYFQNLIYGNNTKQYYNFLEKEISQHNVLDFITNMENDFFLDVDIIKKQNLAYEDIIPLDLMLIDSIELLLQAIKTNSNELVDVYKAYKNDNLMIEKCYKLYNNEMLKNLVILNYNCLSNLCHRTKNKIKEFLSFIQIDNFQIENMIRNLKEYSKQDAGIAGYLYLFNFFNV